MADGQLVHPAAAFASQHVWSYDFIEDRTHDGRRFRMLNVIDEFTHECLTIRVSRRLPPLRCFQTSRPEPRLTLQLNLPGIGIYLMKSAKNTPTPMRPFFGTRSFGLSPCISAALLGLGTYGPTSILQRWRSQCVCSFWCTCRSRQACTGSIRIELTEQQSPWSCFLFSFRPRRFKRA